MEVEEELEEKVEVEVEVWRSRRSRKRGGDKVVSGKLLYQFLHSHYEYLLIPPFLRYTPTDHDVRFCSSIKANLDLESHPNTLQASSSNAWQQHKYFL